jgi:hypothetical protein
MKWLLTLCMSVVLAGCTAGKTGRASGEEADVLVEPTIRIGGIMTNGLTHTDIRTWEGMTGSFADFAGRVVEHYAAASGPNLEDAKLSLHGTQFEPWLAL